MLDLAAGTYLAYLDVWERSVTGSTTRASASPPSAPTRPRAARWSGRSGCSTSRGSPTPSTATPTCPRRSARSRPHRPDGRARRTSGGSADLCRPTPAGGYVGLENQLYRVHVHDVDAGRPVVLWSRENASVATTWVVVGRRGHPAGGRAPARTPCSGSSPGDWVELYDDSCVLETRPGTLVRLLDAREDRLTLDVATATGSTAITDFPRNPQVRRWDSPGTVAASGDGWLDLEDGVQVRFPAGGTFHRHDYWLVPARSVLADVDWPRDSGGEPLAVPPSGIRHDTGRLAIVTQSAAGLAVDDCRDLFPSLTTLTADDVSVDNDACDLAGVETVQDAIDALCRATDLRRHNRLLHGHGIVCGLAVHCGSGEGDDGDVLTTEERRRAFEEDREAEVLRRFVTVEPGSAIDADGNDLDVTEPIVVDVLRELESLGDRVLDDDGDGEVSLVLRAHGTAGPTAAVTPFEPRTEREWLAGTPHQRHLRGLHRQAADLGARAARPRHRRGPPRLPAAHRPDQPGQRRRQPAVERHGLRVRQRARGARGVLPRPAQAAGERDVLRDVRRRAPLSRLPVVRSRASGRSPGPATTTAPAPAPAATRCGRRVAASTPSSRAPWSTATACARSGWSRGWTPLAGSSSTRDARSSTAAAAVTDIAFSPDGKLVAVAVPTRDGNDTLFRVGEVGDSGVRWRPATTICGVKLVTLATTDADPDHVYAVGLRRTTTEGKAFSLREYTGRRVSGRSRGTTSRTRWARSSRRRTSTPSGTWRSRPRGEAVFTVGADGGTAESYDRIGWLRLPDQASLAGASAARHRGPTTSPSSSTAVLRRDVGLGRHRQRAATARSPVRAGQRPAGGERARRGPAGGSRSSP